MKQLNRTTVENLPQYPERIIQFGEGNFLRAFVDWMVQKMNQEAGFGSSVAVVQPIRRGLADAINRQDGLYHLVLQGIRAGNAVEETMLVDCVSRCVDPYRDFTSYRRLIEQPAVRFVVSNTTEAGIAWADGETLDMRPQPSFPGKMAALLYHRYKTFDAAEDKGLIVLCCELIEDNADVLKTLVVRHARTWGLDEAFFVWLEDACEFCSTLVDRIVTGYPSDGIARYQERFGFQDELIDVGELYHSWAIKAPPWVEDEFPAARAGLNVKFVDEAQQRTVRQQKVRILNGAHTGTVATAYLCGIDTVREAVEDELLERFIREMVFEEILPNVSGDPAYLVDFAASILERFRNPYLRHEWMAIALNSMSKWQTRNMPSLLDYHESTGRLPVRLCFSLAALIVFYRGRRGRNWEIEYQCGDNDEKVLALFATRWNNYDGSAESRRTLVEAILGYEEIWNTNLNQLPGLTDLVAQWLGKILELGPRSALCQLIEPIEAESAR